VRRWLPDSDEFATVHFPGPPAGGIVAPAERGGKARVGSFVLMTSARRRSGRPLRALMSHAAERCHPKEALHVLVAGFARSPLEHAEEFHAFAKTIPAAPSGRRCARARTPAVKQAQLGLARRREREGDCGAEEAGAIAQGMDRGRVGGNGTGDRAEGRA
jgi:hypothetical protein